MRFIKPNAPGRRRSRTFDRMYGVDPEPVAASDAAHRVESWNSRCPDVPHGGDGRRRRQRLAARPGGVNDGVGSDDRARRAQVGPGANAWLTIAPAGRWAARSTTSPCSSASSPRPTTTTAVPPIDVPDEIVPPDQPLHVASSPDLGVPVDNAAQRAQRLRDLAIVDLGWDVTDDEPALDLASNCFRVLRAWNIADDRRPASTTAWTRSSRRSGRDPSGSAVHRGWVATAFGQLGAAVARPSTSSTAATTCWPPR